MQLAWHENIHHNSAVAAKLQGLYSEAGYLAGAHLGLHPALMTLDNGISLLVAYLESHAQCRLGQTVPEGIDQSCSVPRTAIELWQGFGSACQTTLEQLQRALPG